MNEAFYVSWVNGAKYGLLAGPYATHEEAKKNVDTARKLAIGMSSKGCFVAYGTVRLKSKPFPMGTLNEMGLLK